MTHDKTIAFHFSIIDYLLDETIAYHCNSRPQLIHQLHKNISRDLEDLLNSKKRCLSSPKNLSELSRSIINYGIVDFINCESNSMSYSEELSVKIEETIKLFETRLTNVRVICEKVSNKVGSDRTIKFRIEASIHLESIDDFVVFDLTLKSENEIASYSAVELN